MAYRETMENNGMEAGRAKNQIPYCTVVLVALNVILFLIGLILPKAGEWMESEGCFSVVYLLYEHSGFYRLITAAFLHADVEHLLNNMLLLYCCGDVVERCLGKVRFLILYFGSKNILGSGWTSWDVAAFTTFLACYTKLSDKSSKAAKLFNAVHKAQVSWKRIQPLMREIPAVPAVSAGRVERLEIRDLTCGYPGDAPLFSGLDLTACRGQIIGVTGPVACGKSTLGKAFLCEQPYGGSIRLDGRELAELSPWELTGLVGYLGHDPELFSGTILENVLLGDTGDPMDYLRAVCLDGEVAAMTEGLETRVGTGGVRLSGGQAQRLALARTLAHQRPLLILDDPFSALDRATETEIFAHLRRLAADSVVILISHRLYLFPELDRVIWLENGEAKVGTHEELVGNTPDYAAQFDAQREENSHE